MLHVAAQAVLLLITVALAALVGWEAAVVGLALMQLVTTVVVVVVTVGTSVLAGGGVCVGTVTV